MDRACKGTRDGVFVGQDFFRESGQSPFASYMIQYVPLSPQRRTASRSVRLALSQYVCVAMRDIFIKKAGTCAPPPPFLFPGSLKPLNIGDSTDQGRERSRWARTALAAVFTRFPVTN